MVKHSKVTELLLAWTQGDKEALEQLVPLVQDEVQRLAIRYMQGERPGHTLQATALVNEAYMRLIAWKNVEWQNRAHFFGVAAQIMRRILVDYARSRGAAKGRPGRKQVSLEEAAVFSMDDVSSLIAVDHALRRLATAYPRKAQIVELRFFGGMTVQETAEVLKLSSNTVLRDWDFAKSWLLREMSHEISK